MKTVSLHSDLAWLDGRQSPTEARKPQGRWRPTGARRCARRAVQLALALVPAFFPITAGAVPIIGWARPNYFVAEDVGAVDLVVQRSGDLNGRVNIDFHTEALTATPGADYVEVSGTVTFESGETTHTVTVPILNDGLVEPAEGLFVVLDPPDEGAEIGNPKAMVLLRDNDRPVTVELPGYSVNEDARLLAIRVIRGDDGGAAVTVDYRLVPGTAEPGADYEETSGSLELPPGVPFGTLVVPLLNDTVSEPGEDFQVVLSNPTNGASLGSPSSATITITDTDDLVQFVSSRLSVSEAATMAELTIIRGENTAVATVEVETTDYSAGAGEDYEAVNRNLSWEPGQRLQVVQIPLLKDGVKEPSESFRVTLSNPGGGARLGPNVLATVIILDDDSGVGFTTVRHAVWGKSEVAEIEVSRGSDAWDGAFTVDYHTADGSARAGVDFAETSGTLHFVAGELAKVIPVRLMARADPPQLRTFTITLDNVTGLIPLNDSLQTVFVDIASPAAGYVMNVSPPIEAEAHRNDDRVKITWSGAADLLRSSSVTGPWESLGAVDSPLVTSPAAATAFYQLRSSRPARLFVPSSYDGVEPMPLIMALDGYGHTPSSSRFARGQDKAETDGFLLCDPSGTVDPGGRGFWNATDACCNFYGSGVDDSAYLRAVIEEVARQYPVDSRRIFVTGASNGGFMSYRMASEHADLIAGIAAYMGVTFLDPTPDHPSQPVHVLHIHGTADDVVPYDGGTLGAGLPVLAHTPGALATVERWAGLNGCATPVWDPEPTMDLFDYLPGLDTTAMRYTDSPPGGEVELWTVRNGTHTGELRFWHSVFDWLLAHPRP